MQPRTMAAIDPGVVRRLTIALLVSVALHVAVLFVIRAQPPTARHSGATPIVAWIERTAAVTESAEAPLAPQFVPAESPAPEPAPVAVTEPVATPSPTVPESAQPSAQVVRPEPGDARPAIEIPALRDPTYYPIGSLDRLPMLIGSADVCYPEGATSEVAYLLLIDEAGSVNEATVLEVKPEGLFTAAAMEACRNLKFTPGRKDARAVRSRVRFVVGPTLPGAAPLK